MLKWGWYNTRYHIGLVVMICLSLLVFEIYFLSLQKKGSRLMTSSLSCEKCIQLYKYHWIQDTQVSLPSKISSCHPIIVNPWTQPLLLAATDSLWFLVVVPIPEYHINVIMNYVTFFTWCFSHSIFAFEIYLCFVHINIFFLLPSSISVYGCIIYFLSI